MSDSKQANGLGTVPGTRTQPERREPAATPSPSGLTDYAWRVVVTILLLAIAYLLWSGIHVLLLIFAGVLFAIFLWSPSDWVSRRTRMGHRWSLAVVGVLLFVLLGGLTWLLANRLLNQFAKLEQQVPQSLNEIRESLEATPWGRNLLERAPQAAEALSPEGVFARLTRLVSGVFGFLMASIVIVIVGIFGSAEPELYKSGLLYLVPSAQRRRVEEALGAVVFNLRWWLVGQLCLMVVMGATTAVGLGLMGIPLALTLGLIAGILEIIPYIGPWVSVVPAALIALPMGSGHVVMVLLLYLGLHILEGYVLVPLIQRRAIHLPPALTLGAQILLGELLGVLGLLVAAPLTVSAVVFVKMLYVKDALGEQSVEVPGESNHDSGTADGQEKSRP